MRQPLVQRPDEAGLAGGQKLGQGRGVVAQRRAEGHGGGKVEAEDQAVPREPELALAAQQRVPRRPAGVGQRLVREVGAALAVGAGPSLGTGPPLRGAALAVGGAAAEVPGGQRRQAFFSRSSSRAGPR